MPKIVYRFSATRLVVFNDENTALDMFDGFSEKFNETFPDGWTVTMEPDLEVEALLNPQSNVKDN